MEFKKYRLGDIIKEIIDYRGKTPKKLGGNWAKSGIKAISAKNIKTGKIVQPETIRFVDEKLYKKWMKQEVEKGTILITSEAPFGEIFYWDSEEKIVLSQRIFGLKIKQEYNSKFIYYFMSTKKFQDELRARATGSTVMGLRQPELLKCKIIIPDREVQDNMVEILNALDKKIELNNKINDNLHKLVKTIYKEWFESETILNNGSFDKLGNYIDIERGLSYKGKFLADEGTPMINLGNVMPDGVFRLEKNKYYTGDYKDKVTAKVGDIVIANTDMTQDRAVIGTPVIIPPIYDNSIIFSHHIYGVKNLKLPKMYLFYSLLSDRYNNIVAGAATGTTVLALPKEVIQNYDILIPNEEQLDKFELLASTIQKRREQIILENIQLEKIRDTLLPKLMNGEIDIDKIEI